MLTVNCLNWKAGNFPCNPLHTDLPALCAPCCERYTAMSKTEREDEYDRLERMVPHPQLEALMDQNDKRRKLPHPALLNEAWDWLRAGCPAVWSHFNEKGNVRRARKTLLNLVDAIPSHFDQYAYGTDANKAAWEEEIVGEDE